MHDCPAYQAARAFAAADARFDCALQHTSAEPSDDAHDALLRADREFAAAIPQSISDVREKLSRARRDLDAMCDVAPGSLPAGVMFAAAGAVREAEHAAAIGGPDTLPALCEALAAVRLAELAIELEDCTQFDVAGIVDHVRTALAGASRVQPPAS